MYRTANINNPFQIKKKKKEIRIELQTLTIHSKLKLINKENHLLQEKHMGRCRIINIIRSRNLIGSCDYYCYKLGTDKDSG